MDNIAAAVVVLGALFVLAVAARWNRPKGREQVEQDERRAIERQGVILAEGARLQQVTNPQEVADEVNKAFK